MLDKQCRPRGGGGDRAHAAAVHSALRALDREAGAVFNFIGNVIRV